MRKTWLIVDMSYLCFRAFYSVGHLTHNDIFIGVIFGVIRDIVNLMDKFDTPNIVFAFDSKVNKRKKMIDGYKAKRSEQRASASDEDKHLREEFIRQVVLLRKRILPESGFNNVFVQRGYEGDDIIASVALNLPKGENGIIIGSDKDLYQLLSPSISMFNPNRTRVLTMEWFIANYGIEPMQYADVKAIAGCTSDDIVGVPGVGETTAIKFLTGKLRPASLKYHAIIANNELWRRNLELVQLPLKGCKVFELNKDDVTKKKWVRLMKELGMESLKGKPPIPARMRRTHGQRK